MIPVKRRACTACTIAKAKCTPETVNICQRCARLHKECRYLEVSQVKRRNKNRFPQNSPGTLAESDRVEILENRIEQLVSQVELLTRQHGQTISPGQSVPSAASEGTNLHAAALNLPMDVINDASHGIEVSTASALVDEPSILDRGLLSPAQAEALIDAFRVSFVQKFPFVVIPRGVRASRLVKQQPFLSLCIFSATINSGHNLRKTITDEFMKHVTVRIVAGSERNIELLRGLLVYTAWYSFPAQRNHPQLLLLMQLCISMLHDLRLQTKADLSTDEQRALLGTYWLAVGLCKTVGRETVLKQDARIAECVRSLATVVQKPSDVWIEQFIRVQSFMETLYENYELLQHVNGGSVSIQTTRGRLSRQLKELTDRVDDYSPEISTAMRLEFKFAEMRLEQPSLRGELWDGSDPASLRPTMLLAFIRRSREFILMISALPMSEMRALTIASHAHLCTALGCLPMAVTTLLELIVAKADAMPLTEALQSEALAVYQEADYPNLVRQLAGALETQLDGLSEAAREADILGSVCSRTKVLARCFPARVRNIVDLDYFQATLSKEAFTDANTQPAHLEYASSNWSLPSGIQDDHHAIQFSEEQWATMLSDLTSF